MFERLLQPQPAHRWTTIASLILQCALAAAILAIPMLHPASLSFHVDAPRLFIPLTPTPPPPPPQMAASTAATPAPASAPAAAPAGRPLSLISHPGPTTEDAPPSLNPIRGMGTGDSALPGEIAGTGNSTSTRIGVVRAAPAAPVRVSRGVVAGLLLAPIRPIYPRVAVATRTEGTVVVEAIISKSGTIESAHATSGPPLLREAAIDAIRNARYSPYLLNGIPTEVQTTITVTFQLRS